MKAAQLTAYDSQPSLEITDIDKPSISGDQVLVEAYAASVNPFDIKLQTGTYKDSIPLNLPATLGGDVAGVVAEVGEDVSGFAVGQPVFGQAGAAGGHGSFAEFTPVKATSLVAKPEQIDYVSAAALPLVAVSAYQALADHMGLKAGQKILIHGAAGGIGSMAVQIAKDIGAHIVATASADEFDYVKELGADELIDYKTQDFSQIVSGCDAVFDTVGGETNSKSYEVLKSGGTLVSMVQPADEAKAAEKDITYVQQQSRPTPERLAAIVRLVEKGALKVYVDKTFPLEQAAEALDYLKTRHVRGKVVITIKQ